VPSETPSVSQGELTPSSSFTQLGGMWKRDLDLGAKVGPSARAPWRWFGEARVPELTGPTRTDAVGLGRNGRTVQTNSPRFLLR
jgi:hypothetical protein